MKAVTEIKTEHLTYIDSLADPALPRDSNEEHAHHDEIEIYHFVEGELFFSFEGDRFSVSDGDVIIIANGSLHKTIIKSPVRYHRRRLLIKNSFFASMPGGAFELQKRLSKKGMILIPAKSIDGTALKSLLQSIEQSLEKKTPYDSFCAWSYLSMLLIEAEKIGAERKNTNAHFGSKSRKIIEYIDENITESLDYESIAERFHISVKNLYKIFKNETGFTLSKYIRIRRIIKAKALLNSGASPIEASTQSGFSDYSVFYRSFCSELGTSPSKYVSKLKR